MSVTVRKVMDIATFSEAAAIVAGHDGIDKVITYITVSETPDFYEWVSGGEFVLTTLYAFKDNKDRQIVNYTELAKRGVAALGVKVSRFVDVVPQELIDIANQYQVPLFAIRREAKFREVIQAISAEINNLQTNMLIEVDGHYKELARIALVGGSFNEYIRGFGRRKGCNVYCFEANLNLLASYQKATGGDAVQPVKEKLEQYLIKQGQLFSPVNDDGLQIFPCVMRGQALGYLIILSEGYLSEKQMLMASQLTTFLTLKLVEQLETEQKLLTALLDELLYKRHLSEEELRERLSLYGLKNQNRYRVIVVREKDEKGVLLPGSQIRILCNKIREWLDGALVIDKINEIVIIATNEQPDNAKLPGWLKNMGKEVFSDTYPIVIGIGPSVVQAREIHSSYQIAKSTIKAGRAFGQSGALYYAHYLARNLVLASVGTPEQEYLLTNIINPLLDQDNRYNTQIMATIEATIFADDLEQAASALFVHTNTIRYRLNKIKSITGYDFFSAKGRYAITTAYFVHLYNR